MFHFSDYRELIADRFKERRQMNPSYSLRAFARDLGIPAGNLSNLLKGKLGLSNERANQIASCLKLRKDEQEMFLLMVESSDSRSKINREESQRRLTDRIKDLAYSKLSEETFELISNWHYYAFFELLETKNFVFKPSWISERLKIDFFDSEKMIENLKRLKILKKIGNSWKLSQKNYSSIDQVPSYSIRKFTKQVLVKAIDAIDSQSIDERLIGTVTSAIHLEDLPKIMDKINAQKFELDRYIAQLNSKKNVKPDEVYTYAVQFFRISQTVRSSLSSSLKENN